MAREREYMQDAPQVARSPRPEPVVRPTGVASRLALQRSAGNRAVQRMLQRAVYKAGGKKAAVIPQEAKTVARYVLSKTSVQPGGSNYIANIQNRGFPGFKMFKTEYAGGRVFDNDAQPDHNKLPYLGGQTYQEWDIHPCVVGQGRGVERIVTSSDGKAYYSGDHYRNFTEFTP